jgi:hypothetical protein
MVCIVAISSEPTPRGPRFCLVDTFRTPHPSFHNWDSRPFQSHEDCAFITTPIPEASLAQSGGWNIDLASEHLE